MKRAAVAMVLVMAGSLQASLYVSGVPAAGVNDYQLNAVADTHICSGTSDTSYGESMNLAGNAWAGPWVDASLLRFDVSSLSGKTVTKAELYLLSYPSYFKAGNPDLAVDLKTVDTGFTESISWNSYGGLAHFTGPVQDTMTLVASDWGDFRWFKFTVDPSVIQGWINSPSSNYGFGIQPQNEGFNPTDFGLATRSDTANHPVLMITVVPEPATMGLLVLGGWILRRKSFRF